MSSDPLSRSGSEPASAAVEDRKPLTWLGCGCALVVGTILAFVVAGSYATWRASERFSEGRETPALAAEQTREVLPWQRLPDGFHPIGAMEMPLGLLRMAVFADAAPGVESEASAEAAVQEVSSGFFFVDMPDWMDRKEKMARVFRGEEGDPGSIAQVEVTFEGREDLGRGELAGLGAPGAEGGPAEVLWYARRGELEISDASFGFAAEDAAPRRAPGIATMLLFDCPDLDRLRLGLWFAAEPRPGGANEEASLAGTPADPDTIARFLSSFSLCER